MLNVQELIDMLIRVEDKEAVVFVDDSSEIDNAVTKAVIEHDLNDDEVVVVLKTD